jgi:tetratricopeptide (TPR) repeat protein
MAGLTGGLAVASRERTIAQRRFNEVRQLSDRLIEIDFQVRELPGGTKTRQFIVDTSLDYLRRLSADVRGDAALALDLGHAYLRVARVQGVPIGANLGQVENAEQSLRMAEGLIQSVLKAQPANRTAFIRAAQVAHDRMVLAQGRRPDTEALPLARRADEWLTKYLESGEVDDFVKQQVSIVATNVASWYVHEDLMDDALRLIRQGIAIAMATKQLPQAGATHIALARALRSVGDLEGALAAAREAVRLLEPPPGETGLGRILAFAAAMATQAGILGEDNNISMGRTSEAISLYERAFDIVIGYVRKDANDSLSRFNASLFGARLARLHEDHDPRRALAINDELLLRLREIRNNTRARRYEVPTLVRTSYLLRRLGREAEGRERLKMAFANLRDLKMYPSEQVELGSEPDHAVRALAEQEAAGGNTRRGGQIYEELLGKIMASKPKPESRLADAYDLSTLYSAMGVLYRKAGQGGPATAMDSRRLELWQRWHRKLPKNVFVRKQLDGAAASQR